MEPGNNRKIGVVALEVAVSQLGQSEEPKGSNSGPMVDKYLASVDKKPGLPWCMAFVFFCFLTASTQETTAGDLPVKTAGVKDCWNRTKANMKVMAVEAKHRPELVQPGMQFVLSFGNNTGHTGLVESVDAATGLYHTIEGNSNNTGSREGYEVVRHTRKLSDPNLLGFVKY